MCLGGVSLVSIDSNIKEMSGADNQCQDHTSTYWATYPMLIPNARLVT